MLIFSVVGPGREANKTDVVEALVKEFVSRGYKVGTIKHTHKADFTIDTPGKDTFRHARAGATIVASVAKGETAFIKSQSEPELEQLIEFLRDIDVIIIEGWHSIGQPKLIVGTNAKEVQEILSDGYSIAVTGPIVKNEEEKLQLKSKTNVEILDHETEIGRLVNVIENKLSKISTKVVKLTVNEKQIPLKSFVQDFIKTTVVGMLSSLKDVDSNAKEIKLVVKKT
ncbi:MAG: molybdopterin-guanine dinucleotide biosynthesis protein B [Euryarchaeota archaeon]|nr:molybdopterin-guanine dinucleotide biosynthesis protein B [Euryarchaeota archaeon]